jgi:predicted transcriptional regulator
MKKLKRILFIATITLGSVVFYSFLSGETNKQKIQELQGKIENGQPINYLVLEEYVASVDIPKQVHHRIFPLSLLYAIIGIGLRKKQDLVQFLKTMRSLLYFVSGYFIAWIARSK